MCKINLHIKIDLIVYLVVKLKQQLWQAQILMDFEVCPEHKVECFEYKNVFPRCHKRPKL